MAEQSSLRHAGAADGSAPPAPFDASEIFNRYQSSVVSIERQRTFLGIPIPDAFTSDYGSGVFVSSGQPHSCEVATVAHESSGYISVQVADGSWYRAHVEQRDNLHGLAVLKLDGVKNPETTCKPVPIAKAVPGKDDPALGIAEYYFERNDANDSTVYHRTVSVPSVYLGSLRRDQLQLPSLAAVPGEKEDSQRMLLAFQGQSRHGYSGAPLFNQEGVVGLLEGHGGNVIFAESANYLQDLMDGSKRAGKTADEAAQKF